MYITPFKFCKLLFFNKSVVMFLKISILSSAGGTGIHSNWLNPKFKCWMSDKYCNKKTKEIFQKKMINSWHCNHLKSHGPIIKDERKKK